MRRTACMFIVGAISVPKVYKKFHEFRLSNHRLVVHKLYAVWYIHRKFVVMFTLVLKHEISLEKFKASAKKKLFSKRSAQLLSKAIENKNAIAKMLKYFIYIDGIENCISFILVWVCVQYMSFLLFFKCSKNVI